MTNLFTPKSRLLGKLVPIKIALIYSLVGGLWIIFSDRWLALLVSDPAKITLYSTYKGWLYVVATAIMLYYLIRQSIYELRNSELALRAMAYTDPLTNLPNRTFLLDKISQELKQTNQSQQVLGVLLIDLDHFKKINDTLGHAIGDSLLQAVASRIAEHAPKEHVIARMGGDEFTLLLPKLSSCEGAHQHAQQILEALSHPFHFEINEFHISASIGIALFPQDGLDGETLLRNADTALYRAKELGRNNYQLFLPAMNDKIIEQLIIEKSLRNALLREEFLIYYQPQFNTVTKQLIGLEALIRWQHPQRGLVTPGQFISIAEDMGLIHPIGQWVLQTACAQNKAWQTAGLPPVRMAVNLSPYQFRQPDLVEMIEQILKQTGLSPHWLELEITESVAMQDVERTISTLQQLQALGIHISIDDFGTGYSSLNYLKQFPINKLKIDQSFIRDIASNQDNQAIVRAIVFLALNLRLGVIAEGVETEEQLLFLQQCQCEEMQGYLFSRPVEAALVAPFFQTNK